MYNMIGGICQTKALRYPSGIIMPHITIASHKKPNLESPPAQNIPPIDIEFNDFAIQ